MIKSRLDKYESEWDIFTISIDCICSDTLINNEITFMEVGEIESMDLNIYNESW